MIGPPAGGITLTFMQHVSVSSAECGGGPRRAQMGVLMSSGVRHADLANRHYCEWVAFLCSSEGWSADQIADYQLRQIREMVRHAYLNTAGYRRLYDRAGIEPDSIKKIEDVRRLPFVEKEMIRDHLEDFSAPMEGRIYVTTGGSTGIPCGMYRDAVSFAREQASKAHQYHRVGWKEGDPQIVFRGLRIDSENHMEFVAKFNELRCSSYHFGTSWMEAYRQAAWDYKPEWIRCYPSSGYVFARYLKDAGLPFPQLKGILCSSEHLYDFQKSLLEEAFGVRTFSHYGHYEMAVLAGFCEYDDAYHVLPQYGYAELIGPDGQSVTRPGDIGEIVGTSFIMHATPFVRYRTQDLALLKGWECTRCGRPYQIWERIEGRLQELLVTRTGRYVSTSMLNMHDDFYDHIKQFQFHQREAGKLTFKYSPQATLDGEIVEEMKGKLMLKLGEDVDIVMEEVDQIPRTPRGKHRLLVQELKLSFDDASLQVPLQM